MNVRAEERQCRSRVVRSLGVGTVLSLALVSCGEGGADDGDVSLSFTWWGPDARHELTQEVIDLYEEENPHVSIEPSFREWGGYWDALATQAAGGDLPDIVQMDSGYLRTYADQGSLLELETVDTSRHDESVVRNGMIDDELFAVTIGINATVMAANVTLFDEADVDLPDDTTWTWEDYAEVSSELDDALPDSHGAEGPFGIATLEMWLRQQGKEIRSPDGDDVGFTVEDAARYFELQLELMQQGAYPGADVISENQSAGHEQSLAGQGRAALSTWSSNELLAIATATGDEFTPLRLPRQSESPSRPDTYYKSSMYLSGSAGTEHPEEVQHFIDFFANSTAAGEILRTERGVPPNADVLDAVLPGLTGLDADIAEFLRGMEGEVGDPPPLPPSGGADFGQIVQRYELEVFFERLSPRQAAESMVEEMSV
ncbi:extracellular solute-binding protein [Nesterenkonia xinjiangensis]|nr:ABC transporter substrate-binding protein [Nesterenkonia xinjiangensis]